jgi:hypothetical protein
MIRFAAFSAVLAVATVTQATPDPLAAARWKNRVLVVIAPTSTDEKLAIQRNLFEEAARGMKERHLILIEAVGDSSSALMLQRRFGLTSKDFCALLIGKDGHTAISSSEPLTSDRLFRTIDAMPMRQKEMRRKPEPQK